MKPPFLPSARQTNWLLVIGFASLGYALYLRYLVIEQSSVSLACEGGLQTDGALTWSGRAAPISPACPPSVCPSASSPRSTCSGDSGTICRKREHAITAWHLSPLQGIRVPGLRCRPTFRD